MFYLQNIKWKSKFILKLKCSLCGLKLAFFLFCSIIGKELAFYGAVNIWVTQITGLHFIMHPSILLAPTLQRSFNPEDWSHINLLTG